MTELVIATVSIAIVSLLCGLPALRMAKRKAFDIWLFPYILEAIKPRPAVAPGQQVDVMFCIVDHFEPKYVKHDYSRVGAPQLTTLTTRDEEIEIVDAWIEKYPRMAGAHKDSDGLPPRHTWCYPIENFDHDHVGKLAGLCRRGYGEIEIHLHHFQDTAEHLAQTLESGKQELSVHGATVSAQGAGERRFAFVHGNWALDNSSGDWCCGVNNELEILKKSGCFADFTLPSAPSRTQTRKINSIYYAQDDPLKPKSHDTGVDVSVGGKEEGTLMIIQGPLCLNWKKRKLGIFPAIENAEIHPNHPVTPHRVRLWLKTAVHVKGRPNWIFIKVHCHGAVRRDLDGFLEEPAHRMHEFLAAEIKDVPNHRLHYVTAREMYNVIKAAEDGKTGNPHAYRDYVIPPYLNSR
jgi:hypothetical protein